MHHFYRNRLIRCYLGRRHSGRRQQPFTGFDPDDDLGLADLDPSRNVAAIGPYEGPLPVINTALTSSAGSGWPGKEGRRLVHLTPLHAAAAASGTRPRRADRWGGDSRAASRASATGASATRARLPADDRLRIPQMAASRWGRSWDLRRRRQPQHGVHSSPAVTFLLTVFTCGWDGGWKPARQNEVARGGAALGLGYLLNELVAERMRTRHTSISRGGTSRTRPVRAGAAACRFYRVDGEADPEMTSRARERHPQVRVDFASRSSSTSRR